MVSTVPKSRGSVIPVKIRRIVSVLADPRRSFASQFSAIQPDRVRNVGRPASR
jgi:hypothetical protein